MRTDLLIENENIRPIDAAILACQQAVETNVQSSYDTPPGELRDRPQGIEIGNRSGLT